MKKYILHFRDGNDKYHVHTYQKSLKDAIDEGNEISSHSYHSFIKANFLSEKRSNKKTMAKYRVYSTNAGYGDGSKKDYLKTVSLIPNKDIDNQLESIFKTESHNLIAKRVKSKKANYSKTKTMAKKRIYKKMVNKASSKRTNSETGTAMSTKKYKLVMMKKSAMKPNKSGIKFTSASGTAVNKMITDFRKKCGCAIKWQLYTYRTSLKAYRLSKASR